jgi:hypothetical protein
MPFIVHEYGEDGVFEIIEYHERYIKNPDLYSATPQEARDKYWNMLCEIERSISYRQSELAKWEKEMNKDE